MNYVKKKVWQWIDVFDSKAISILENSPILKVTSDDDCIAMKDVVLHGAMSSRFYYSKTFKQTQRLQVCTPSGFEKSNEKLPVLYLIHGGGGTDKSRITIGCVRTILDNLLAEDKIQTMIVVMPNGVIEAEYILDRVPLFKDDLRTNDIPLIESLGRYTSVVLRKNLNNI